MCIRDSSSPFLSSLFPFPASCSPPLPSSPSPNQTQQKSPKEKNKPTFPPPIKFHNNPLIAILSQIQDIFLLRLLLIFAISPSIAASLASRSVSSTTAAAGVVAPARTAARAAAEGCAFGHSVWGGGVGRCGEVWVGVKANRGEEVRAGGTRKSVEEGSLELVGWRLRGWDVRR